MNVEVTEENILKYDLVQLTGNSKEALLQAAKEALESGYTLTCRIPDPVDDVLHMNIFQHGDGVEVSDEELEAFFKHQNPILRKEEGKQDPPGRQINVIPGEVIESHIEEED
jgi:hypothetical protein